jgi:hypothetical protein
MMRGGCGCHMKSKMMRGGCRHKKYDYERFSVFTYKKVVMRGGYHHKQNDEGWQSS